MEQFLFVCMCVYVYVCVYVCVYERLVIDRSWILKITRCIPKVRRVFKAQAEELDYEWGKKKSLETENSLMDLGC